MTMDGTQDSLAGSGGGGRIRPLTIARMVQLVLVGIVLATAFVTAPADRQAEAGNSRFREPLPDLDRRVAAFADATAVALANLQDEQLDSGYLGTDRGEVFASGGSNYQRAIADVLVERELLDGDEATELAQNGIRFIAHQCGKRVGVLATSAIDVPAERRAWWDDNGCEPPFPTFLAWPVYVALSEDPDGAP